MYYATGRRQVRRIRLVVLVAVFALLAASCADDAAEPADSLPSTPEPEQTDPEPVDPPADPDPLVVSDVTVEPNQWMTLAASISATTDRDASVVVTARAGDHVVETPPSPAGTSHAVAVLGMRPEREYELEIVATARDGGTGHQATTFTTGALPDEFPDIEVRVNDGDRMAAGVTVFPIAAIGTGFPDAPARPDVEIPSGYGALVAVDESGEVIWYRQTEGRLSGSAVSANGTIWVIESQLRILEMSPTGEVLRTIEGRSARSLPDRPAPRGESVLVETDTFHHAVLELDNGNLIALGTELVDIGGWDEDPCPDNGVEYDGTVGVIVDLVVEFDPETGVIVDEWSLLDMLDPVTQPGEVFCDAVPFPTWYPDRPEAGDWTHANALALDEANGLLLVSVRHSHSVLAIDFGDDPSNRGALVWQLGPGLDFVLDDGPTSEWHYMQHAPEVLPDGGLIVYDNGNLRPGTTEVDEDGVPPYTRAVIYDLDAEASTATQRWEYVPVDEEGAPIYATFLGDADVLGNGNVLIGHGGIVAIELIEVEGSDEPFPQGRNYARILEVDPSGDDDGEVVFELILRDQRSGWMSFEAERLRSLYEWGTDPR